MDLLIWTILAGMANAFIVAFLNGTLGNTWWFPSSRTIRLSITLPVCFGAAYLLGSAWPSIVVVTLAAGFFSNAVLLLLDRAAIVVTPRR
jgi:hypothetical protein